MTLIDDWHWRYWNTDDETLPVLYRRDEGIMADHWWWRAVVRHWYRKTMPDIDDHYYWRPMILIGCWHCWWLMTSDGRVVTGRQTAMKAVLLMTDERWYDDDHENDVKQKLTLVKLLNDVEAWWSDEELTNWWRAIGNNGKVLLIWWWRRRCSIGKWWYEEYWYRLMLTVPVSIRW